MNITPNGERQKSYNGDMMGAGKLAEKIVIDWLKGHRNGELKDLRDDRQMWHADVDFKFIEPDGSSWYGEIKSDFYMGVTNNVLYEFLRINHVSSMFPVVLGWSFRSEADRLFIYGPQVRKIYTVTFSEYRHAFQRVSLGLRVGSLQFKVVKTDTDTTTINIYVPELMDIFKVYEVENG